MSILLANAIQLMDILMSGILPRNPDLRVVSVESGIGWLPFVKEALDHGFDYANVRAEKPEFTKRPSEYLREQVWACTFFEEFAAKNLLEEIGTNRVLFETDYPHPICLYGDDVRKKIDAAFGDHTQEIRNQVLFGNAAELYRVDAPDRPWKKRSTEPVALP
jgi:predicted TIM-barrel fold metal-dependent hydrolase